MQYREGLWRGCQWFCYLCSGQDVRRQHDQVLRLAIRSESSTVPEVKLIPKAGLQIDQVVECHQLPEGKTGAF